MAFIKNICLTDRRIYYGDRDISGLILLRKYEDYYHGYIDDYDKKQLGYVDIVNELTTKFPLSEPKIIGEKREKEFIALFGSLLRMRNILVSFDDFEGQDILSEQDLQDYLGRYQDLRDEWNSRRKHGDVTDVTEDIVFEIDLIKQIEINIDYILLLVKQYHDDNCADYTILARIRKAVDASPELRSKKSLIEAFIANVSGEKDVMDEWHDFVEIQRNEDIVALIAEENLKEEETLKFVATSLQTGEVKTMGTDIDKILPPTPFFGGNRTEKKQRVIDKLIAFVQKYFGV